MSSDTPDHLDPAKWADMLGFIPLPDSSLKIQNETERETVFQEKFYSKTQAHQISGLAALNLQRNLWANFTSKYLPLLVDRILTLPPPSSAWLGDEAHSLYPIQNIYHTTLKFTDHAYLARFMTSTHPIAQGGKRLPRVMAERLVEFGPIWQRNKNPDYYQGCIHRAVTTLMMLVIAAKGHDIPKRTRRELLHWLDTWATYDSWTPVSTTYGETLPAACNTLSNLFKHGAALAPVIKQRRRALKCVEVCALPACAIETGLKVCKRRADFPFPHFMVDTKLPTVGVRQLPIAPRFINASTGKPNTRNAALKLNIDPFDGEGLRELSWFKQHFRT